jgi:hypothetical protein
MRNDNTSPVTKNLVMRFGETIEKLSACIIVIILPSSMYIEAANKAGARSRRVFWIT